MSLNVKCHSCGNTYFHKSINYAKEVCRHNLNCIGFRNNNKPSTFISVQNEMPPYVNNQTVLQTVRLENDEVDDLSSIKDLQCLFHLNETKTNDDDRNPLELFDQQYDDFMDHQDNDAAHEQSEVYYDFYI